MKKLLAALSLAFLLAGCETEGGLLFTYGAQGTQIQAERLVAQVYGKPAKPLPYGNADIDQAVARMKARWPQIKAELEAGIIGLTDHGEVAIRITGDAAKPLRKLVRDENRDRQLLYRAMGQAIGHTGAAELTWLAYTEDVFAQEWLKQAPSHWWFRDESQVWRKK